MILRSKQNILHLLLCTAFFILFLYFCSANAFAASITRDPDSFDDIAIAQVSSAVNIRSKSTTNSKIVGKMQNNAAAVIKKTVKGEGGTWYYISSGSVTGYVKAAYFKTGSAAAKIASQTGTLRAKVTASGLRMRKQATTNSSTVTVLSQNTKVTVLKKKVNGTDGRAFSKVKYTKSGTSKTGYVAHSYIQFCYSMKTASKSSTASSSQTTGTTSSSTSSGNMSHSASSGSNSSSVSSSGSSIAATAKQYVGKLPYVWGGTSLKTGADCSGFVQSIYKLHKISIPRTSTSQAAGGRSIKRSQLQKGDLVFYKNGKQSISHVAIYIGNSQIVHEANSKSGCKISHIDYDTPVKYVTYLR